MRRTAKDQETESGRSKKSLREILKEAADDTDYARPASQQQPAGAPPPQDRAQDRMRERPPGPNTIRLSDKLAEHELEDADGGNARVHEFPVRERAVQRVRAADPAPRPLDELILAPEELHDQAGTRPVDVRAPDHRPLPVDISFHIGHQGANHANAGVANQRRRMTIWLPIVLGVSVAVTAILGFVILIAGQPAGTTGQSVGQTTAARQASSSAQQTQVQDPNPGPPAAGAKDAGWNARKPPDLDKDRAGSSPAIAAIDATQMPAGPQTPAAPRLVMTPRLELGSVVFTPVSKETAFPIRIEGAEAIANSAAVTIRGLPENARLNKGRALSPGVWALKLDELDNLSIVALTNAAAARELSVELFTADGTLLSRASAVIEVRATPASASIYGKTEDEESARRLLVRGEQLLVEGDVAGARGFFKRAADAGDPQASVAMGASYDPVVFAQFRIQGMQPDPAMARQWYRRAVDLGSKDAQERLDRLGPK